MEEEEEIISKYQSGGQTMSEGYLTHQKGGKGLRAVVYTRS